MFDEWVKFKSGEVMITTESTVAHPLMHQYAGVQCKHTSIDRKLVRLGISSSKYFNPDWWYSLWYRYDGTFLYVVPIPGMKNVSEKVLRTHPDRIYMYDLKRLLEDELNLLNKDYSDFVILGDVQEAYLHVEFMHKGTMEDGYVLWENCD
jgi:hypothetical protein